MRRASPAVSSLPYFSIWLDRGIISIAEVELDLVVRRDGSATRAVLTDVERTLLAGMVTETGDRAGVACARVFAQIQRATELEANQPFDPSTRERRELQGCVADYVAALQAVHSPLGATQVVLRTMVSLSTTGPAPGERAVFDDVADWVTHAYSTARPVRSATLEEARREGRLIRALGADLFAMLAHALLAVARAGEDRSTVFRNVAATACDKGILPEEMLMAIRVMGHRLIGVNSAEAARFERQWHSTVLTMMVAYYRRRNVPAAPPPTKKRGGST